MGAPPDGGCVMAQGPALEATRVRQVAPRDTAEQQYARYGVDHGPPCFLHHRVGSLRVSGVRDGWLSSTPDVDRWLAARVGSLGDFPHPIPERFPPGLARSYIGRRTGKIEKIATTVTVCCGRLFEPQRRGCAGRFKQRTDTLAIRLSDVDQRHSAGC